MNLNGYTKYNGDPLDLPVERDIILAIAYLREGEFSFYSSDLIWIEPYGRERRLVIRHSSSTGYEENQELDLESDEARLYLSNAEAFYVLPELPKERVA